jgi:RimJ/RimL family protein N-acetyltransferase
VAAKGRNSRGKGALGRAMQTLTSERLVLRMFRESDLDAYAEMCGDAEVMRFMGDGHTLSRAEAWRNMALIIGHWHLRGFGLWAVEERQTGLLAGRVGCWQPEGWPGLELGWALHRAFWGKGYATEAGLKAIDFAFNQLGKTRVISLIQQENSGSVAVAVRLGMRFAQETELMGKRVLMYALNARQRVEP